MYLIKTTYKKSNNDYTYSEETSNYDDLIFKKEKIIDYWLRFLCSYVNQQELYNTSSYLLFDKDEKREMILNKKISIIENEIKFLNSIKKETDENIEFKFEIVEI